jgi:hypothetical protein
MRAVSKRLRWIAFGAGVGWLFDLEQGPARRDRVRRSARHGAQRVHAIVGAGSRRLPEPARARVNRAAALVFGAQSADAALAEFLRREVLAPAGAQQLELYASHGHVVLEGDLPGSMTADKLAERIRMVPGVVELSVRIQTP